MNDPKGKSQSDIDCQKIVAYALAHGHTARLATEDEDEKLKFDYIIDGHKIDLKRFGSMYCEIDKLQNPRNEAEFILMIVGGDTRNAYKFRKDALVRICAKYIKPLPSLDFDETPILNECKNENVKYRIGPKSGDLLADFTLDMLQKDDYEIVDLSKILS